MTAGLIGGVIGFLAGLVLVFLVRSVIAKMKSREDSGSFDAPSPNMLRWASRVDVVFLMIIGYVVGAYFFG